MNICRLGQGLWVAHPGAARHGALSLAGTAPSMRRPSAVGQAAVLCGLPGLQCLPQTAHLRGYCLQASPPSPRAAHPRQRARQKKLGGLHSASHSFPPRPLVTQLSPQCGSEGGSHTDRAPWWHHGEGSARLETTAGRVDSGSESVSHCSRGVGCVRLDYRSASLKEGRKDRLLHLWDGWRDGISRSCGHPSPGQLATHPIKGRGGALTQMLQVSEDRVELRGRLFHDHMVSSGLQENRTCWDQEQLEAPFLVSRKLGTQRPVVRAGASNCMLHPGW